MASYEEFDHEMALDRRILVIGDEKIPVSASILSTHTKYFNMLFMQGFKERDSLEVPIEMVPGMDAEAVRTFVRHCYPKHAPINASTYKRLLSAGDFFNAPFLLQEVEKYIISHCNPSSWNSYNQAAAKLHKENADIVDGANGDGKKKDKSLPFQITLLTGIELAFTYPLKELKNHVEAMVLRYRFHTFLKLFPDCLMMDAQITDWIFRVYAKHIIAEQKA